MIDVILPALNEAPAIATVLERMPAGFRPIVVDNGSTDATAEIARARGVAVVHEPTRGFGAACRAGLDAATSDVVCFMDCDGSLDAIELPRVARPVVAAAADLVLGERRPVGPGAWPVHARIGNRLVARAVRHRCGVALVDLGPMRAVRRAALVDLDLGDQRFGWPLEMVLRAASVGWRILEVPVTYRARIGRSKVTGTVGGTLRCVRDMAGVLR